MRPLAAQALKLARPRPITSAGAIGRLSRGDAVPEITKREDREQRARVKASLSRPMAASVLAACLLAAAPAGAHADLVDLGPVPPDCGAVGKDYADPSCTTQTRLGVFSLSPHVVHAGGTITGTLAPTCEKRNGDVLGPCPVDWSRTGGAALTPSRGCTPTTYSCTWKVGKDAATQAFSIMTVGITNDQGQGISKDYFAIIGRGSFELAGHVRDLEKRPLAGARVYIAGKLAGKQSGVLTTDTTGQYTAVLPRGSYTVTVQASRSTAVFAPVSSRDCRPSGPSCRVSLTQDRTADFRADQRQHVTLDFDPGAIPADGMSFAAMLITDTNALGEPIGHQAISVSPPLGDPPYLICAPGGRPYPASFPASGSVLGASYRTTTDASGQIAATVVAGTQSGDFASWAEVPGSTARSENAFKSLALTGGPGGAVPESLASNIRTAVTAERGTAGGYLALASALSLTNAGSAQALLLDMLVRFKAAGAVPQLSSVDFAPIHSASGGAGIVFYPRGTPRARILSLGLNARVLDVGELLKSSGGSVTFPDDYPTLAAWEFTGEFPRGQALAGRLQRTPGEELAYFGLPYPPPEGTVNAGGRLGRNTYDQQCVPPDRTLEAVTVHSPVSVLLTGPRGSRVGVDARGRAVKSGVGLVQRVKGGATTIVVPAGTYRLALRGTGSGPATLVSWAAGRAKVVTFSSRRGSRGTASLGPSGLTGARFAGRRLRTTSSVAMRASGLPRTLPGGTRTVRLRVRDQFGAPVVGASVSIGGAVRAAALTNRQGAARLRLHVPRRRARVTARIAAPGFRTLRLTARTAR
jgi:Carboxypeptidase regulatory-like domain